ncbi:MAG: pyridoxamine 5'-phosphate oxidase family protein [Planctomycetia bacterium]|nr:pyridoxamine 5'-phosphate oxidase family protein [Planctomycetia bacterium]
MRRHEREITDPKKIQAILEKCDVCRIGLTDETAPYIVPMNFGFSLENGLLTLYFHGASEGRKLDLIRKNPHVGWEMDTNHQLLEGGNLPCRYGMAYQSLIGTGTITILETTEEKQFGLQKIMEHYAPPRRWHFPPESLKHVTVLALHITSISGKERNFQVL